MFFSVVNVIGVVFIKNHKSFKKVVDVLWNLWYYKNKKYVEQCY